MGVVFLALLVLGAIYGDRGVIDLQRLRAEQRELERIAFQQQAANAQVRDHLRRLRTDDQYLERWARQRLHWAKPGEIIYHFDSPPARGSQASFVNY
ncbi:MAG TPA: septum formation initiator family protein [Candidatus Kryptonia bacterium]|nr:septum formation initiator family protein [Candidatus Kryptonia bacterium]